MAKRSVSLSRSRPPPKPHSPNRLLAALTADEFRRLRPMLTTVPLKFKQSLQKQGENVSHVYFPGGGVCSLTTVMEDGRMVEVATVGSEGVVGIAAFFGDELPPGEALVQVPVPGGEAEMMAVNDFRREMERRGELFELVRRYSIALTALVMQSAACNSLHSAEERCARWLLMTHDRVDGDEFLLTQEFLAVMLGVRRSTVTVIAGALHKARLIDYSHRRIKIVDRSGLEAASCECYRVVHAQFQRLLP